MKVQRLMLLAAVPVAVACSGTGAGSPAETSAETAAQPAAAAASATAGEAPQKNFPDLDYRQQIPYAYRVANEHPEMLAQIPCYCPCELYGHGGVADCYRSQHAAGCATCLEEGVLAGQLLERAGGKGSPELYRQIAEQVKSRYRTAIVQSYVQKNQMPNLQTENGRAYLTVCSDCHQPPHPGMYTADGWRRSLSRMESWSAQRGHDVDPQQWSAAVEYIRTTAAGYPASSGEKYRQDLAGAVAHLKRAEGDTVYYPSSQDPMLQPEWFERMVQAYRLARDIPADVLAATEIDDPACSNLLQCLNTTAAVTSEAAVEAVFRLAKNAGNN